MRIPTERLEISVIRLRTAVSMRTDFIMAELALLDLLQISKAHFPKRTQEMLADLVDISATLEGSENDLIGALGYAVLEELELREEVSEMKAEVAKLQNTYVHSMRFLLELKKLKETTSKQIEQPSETLLKENAFLKRALKSCPQPKVKPELRHETLIELGEECQDAATSAAEIQLTLEQYLELPPNAELARARLEEAQTELEALEEEWNQAISHMLNS
mmetsp:Transcript_25474/g.44335  ORF Transcript_25474/g.44335 Transcript_25474/m.44335 type:complete len:219 (-) Transcript_25474:4018-4674(-)